jgi:ABC-type proline/glycine betaine transport system permease subunit
MSVDACILSHAVVVSLTGNCALLLQTTDRAIEACVKKALSICRATHFHTVSILTGEHEWALFVVHAGRRRFLAHIVDALITLEDAMLVFLALHALIVDAVRGEKLGSTMGVLCAIDDQGRFAPRIDTLAMTLTLTLISSAIGLIGDRITLAVFFIDVAICLWNTRLVTSTAVGIL